VQFKEWHDHARSFASGFKSAYELLRRPLWAIQSATGDNQLTLFPSLFELQLAATLPQLALKSAKSRFSKALPLPAKPTGDYFPPIHQLPIFFEAVFDTEMEMPLSYEARGTLQPEHFRLMGEVLTDWVVESLDVITSPDIFQDSHVQNEDLAQVVRALGFARGLQLPAPPLPDTLYDRCHEAFTAITLHRYSCLILLPIALQLTKRNGKDKRGDSFVSLANKLEAALAAWAIYATANLPIILQVNYLRPLFI
jgi:hypothetical protein